VIAGKLIDHIPTRLPVVGTEVSLVTVSEFVVIVVGYDYVSGVSLDIENKHIYISLKQLTKFFFRKMIL
jgi:hypothetical protein